jgi:hypothetical protein
MHDTKWRTYEEVAKFLINQISQEFGLAHVESKQLVQGIESGTTWEIDAKGVFLDAIGFVVIEMRRHTKSRLSQEDIAAIAYRIQDTGASGGIVVSPLGLQSGADMVAKSSNIISVQLNENSTKTEYILRFLNQVMVALPAEKLSVGLTPLSGTLK